MEKLRLIDAEDYEGWQRWEKKMTPGWCIRNKDCKQALAKELKESKPSLHLEARELEELNELQWESTLNNCLKILGKSKEHIREDKKSAQWMLAVALKIKEETSAKNKWIAQRLNMGNSNSMNHCVSVFARNHPNRIKTYRALKKI